jgi:hypothetical protein
MSRSFRPQLKILAALILSAAIGSPLGGAADDYAFDTAETDKKPYHLGGYAEIQPVLFFLDRDAALYRTRFYDRNVSNPQAEHDFTLQLDGSYERDALKLFARVNNNLSRNYDGWTSDSKPYEAYLAIKPSPSFSTAMGKMTAKWGKGYAWNPVAFVDRPKNPDDPTLNQEGFYYAGLDAIQSFDGPLKTLAFSPLLLPVDGEVNRDFGEPGHINAAARLYLLLWDTDIDFMFLAGGSRPDRVGFDFSRNILPNLEIHGESAWIDDFRRMRLAPDGRVSESEIDAWSALLGLRYLSRLDTTYILEYYRNGTGYGRSEAKGFFNFVDRAFDSFTETGNAGPIEKAATLTQGAYGRPNPMRDYLYFRVSQKEPFDILYLTPAVTTILNLDDRSFSLSPELLYTGITNLELRLKGTVLVGDRFSEFGEKPNDARLELRARYYF